MATTTETVIIEVELRNANAVSEAARLTAELQKQTTEGAKLRKELKELQLAKEQDTKAIKATSEALAANQRAAKETRRELGLYQNTVQAATGSLNSMRAALNMAQKTHDAMTVTTKAERMERDKLAASIRKQSDEVLKLEKATNRSQRNVGNYPSVISQVVSSGVSGGGAGSALSSAAMALGPYGIAAAAVGTALVAATEKAMEFNQALRVLRAENQFSAAEAELLGKQALAISADYGQSAKDVVAAQNELAKSGLTVNQVLAATPAALSLAAAGGLALDESAGLLVTTMTQFGLSAEKAGSVADSFTKAANVTTANTQNLAVAFKYLAPLAGTLNLSLADLSATATALDQAGFKGEQASVFATGLKNLSAPTKVAGEALKKMSVDAFDLNGKFVGIIPLIDQLTKGTAKMTDEQKLANLTQAFGSQAAGEFLALMQMGAPQIDKYKIAIEAAAKGNGAFTDSLAKDKVDPVVALKKQIENLSIEMGQTFAPTLETATRGLAATIKTFREWGEAVGKAYDNVKGFITGVKEAAPVAETLTQKFARLNQEQAAKKEQLKIQQAAIDGDKAEADAIVAKTKAEETEAAAAKRTAKIEEQARKGQIGSIRQLETVLKDLQEQIQREATDSPALTILAQKAKAAEEAVRRAKMAIDEAGQDVVFAHSPTSTKFGDFSPMSSSPYLDQGRLPNTVGGGATDYNGEGVGADKGGKTMTAEEKLQKATEAQVTFNEGLQQTAALVNAIQANQMATIEQKYALELKLAQGNAEKTAAINERMNAEKLASEKKFRKAQAAIQIAQALSDTAAGVIKTIANLGMPLAIPFLAIQGVTTALNIATIVKNAKGFRTGGYTGSGGLDEAAGVVHRGEYVAPANVLATPRGQSLANDLEAIRVGRATGSSGGSGVTAAEVMAMIRNMPPPIVTVSEINTVQANAARRVSVSSL